MSPISEKLYEGPATEYYRRYKGPLRRSRSFHDVRSAPRGYSQTMDELNTRDLNQTTLPVDSTVYTNQINTPNVAPPNAFSTPYHQQPPTGQSYQPNQTSGQSQQPVQQTYPPAAHGSQSHIQPQSQTANPLAPHNPHQQMPAAPQMPIQPPNYQPSHMTSHPVHQPPQQQTAVAPSNAIMPGE